LYQKKQKECSKQKYGDYVIEYHIVETMRFFFESPILFYAFLRVDRVLRVILNLKVLRTFSNYEDFRNKLHKPKLKINNSLEEEKKRLLFDSS